MTNSNKLKFYFLHNKPINSQAPQHHCKDLVITVVVSQAELYPGPHEAGDMEK